MKKRILLLILISGIIIGALFMFGNRKRVVGKDIRIEDVNDFYYTYSNINYNAKYQRYRFYVEDNKYMFFHDTREKKNDYGFLTEEDSIRNGTLEISRQEFEKFFDYIKDGVVIKRQESVESGDSGPWMYLYWKNDKGSIQQFSFRSYETKQEFVDYCEELIEKHK